MAYHHRVTLGPAILEYQLGGILRIAQWQGDVVYLLLVVDDDGVGAVCCHGERVERCLLYTSVRPILWRTATRRTVHNGRKVPGR